MTNIRAFTGGGGFRHCLLGGAERERNAKSRTA